MSLIIENGAGLPNANSFVDVSDADLWLAPLTDAVWDGLTVPEKERHLILAAFFVSNGHIHYFSGSRQTVVQSLAWPRVGAFYRNGGPQVPPSTVPNDVKLAQIVAAQASANGGLPTSPGPGQPGAPGGREVKTEKVGDLSVEYFDPLRSGTKRGVAAPVPLGGDALAELGLPSVTGILAPLLDERFYFKGQPWPAPGGPPLVGPRYTPPAPRSLTWDDDVTAGDVEADRAARR